MSNIDSRRILIWDFYMKILRLSMLFIYMRFLYENLSAINIVYSHEILLWEFLSYQYCSIIWNFYMRISALNIAHSYEIFIWESLSYQSNEILYKNSSTINIAHSYEIFIWESFSYQSDETFIWRFFDYQYCEFTSIRDTRRGLCGHVYAWISWWMRFELMTS
jgi:hypothetical protein